MRSARRTDAAVRVDTRFVSNTNNICLDAAALLRIDVESTRSDLSRKYSDCGFGCVLVMYGTHIWCFCMGMRVRCVCLVACPSEYT